MIIRPLFRYSFLSLLLETFLIYFIVANKMDFDKCIDKVGTIRVFYGIAIENCTNECGKRPGCQYIKYQLSRKACGLYNVSSTELDNWVTQSPRYSKTCILIDRNNINIPECNCSFGMACQANGSCEYEECPPIPEMDPFRGAVKGNMQHIGAKVKVQCTEYFVRVPDNEISICESNGQWLQLPACLRQCSEPCPYLSYTTQVSTGGDIEGDTRNYTCLNGLYVYNTSGVENITIGCTLRGWKYSSLLCVNDTFYPKYPGNIVHVACYVFEINSEAKNYEESHAACEPYGELVKINSVEKLKILNFTFANEKAIWKGPYWVQGKKDKNQWRFSNNEPIDLLTGAVIPGTGDCLTLAKQSSQSVSLVCSEPRSFICEYTGYN